MMCVDDNMPLPSPSIYIDDDFGFGNNQRMDAPPPPVPPQDRRETVYRTPAKNRRPSVIGVEVNHEATEDGANTYDLTGLNQQSRQNPDRVQRNPIHMRNQSVTALSKGPTPRKYSVTPLTSPAMSKSAFANIKRRQASQVSQGDSTIAIKESLRAIKEEHKVGDDLFGQDNFSFTMPKAVTNPRRTTTFLPTAKIARGGSPSTRRTTSPDRLSAIKEKSPSSSPSSLKKTANKHGVDPIMGLPVDVKAIDSRRSPSHEEKSSGRDLRSPSHKEKHSRNANSSPIFGDAKSQDFEM